MKTNDTTILDLIKDIGKGKIQLPDFQRGWVWDDSRIRGLIASITQNFPVGAAMFLEYGNENILICDNYVKLAGGDAITPMYALTPLVEHNVSDSCAAEMNDRVYRYPEKRMGKVAAAIWPWKCKNALFRFNEAVDTKLNQDGMAYGADSGDGTVYENNYSSWQPDWRLHH